MESPGIVFVTDQALYMGIFLKGVLGEFFQGDPYVTYRGSKCVSDD